MKKYRALDILSLTILVIIILTLPITSMFVENIVQGKQFVWIYFLYGLLISFSWTFFLYKTNKGYFSGSEKRASAIISQIFSLIILTIFLSAFYTYQTGKEFTYNKKAILVKKGRNIKSGTSYLHLSIDKKIERFVAKTKEFTFLSIGDTVILTVGKGKTGYEYIYEFKHK